jgi:DNA-binding response OmpR family regulator
MHLLLIEDNATIAHNIVEYLQLEWRSVDHHIDGADGLQYALTRSYDCIILDVMLPSMDGFDLLQELRKHRQTPVIMTTAKWQLHDKTTWFDQGADDYLVKPFELAELVLRIRALTKRQAQRDIIQRRDMQIHMDANTIIIWPDTITLPAKERQLLALLIQADWSVLQRATLIDELRWADASRDAKYDATLDVYISTIRKKLSKDIIQTHKWVGYSFLRLS